MMLWLPEDSTQPWATLGDVCNVSECLCVCVKGRVEEMVRCLAQGIDVNYRHPDTGVSPLMAAAENVRALFSLVWKTTHFSAH